MEGTIGTPLVLAFLPGQLLLAAGIGILVALCIVLIAVSIVFGGSRRPTNVVKSDARRAQGDAPFPPRT